jgi:hypothetical protein
LRKVLEGSSGLARTWPLKVRVVDKEIVSSGRQGLCVAGVLIVGVSGEEAVSPQRQKEARSDRDRFLRGKVVAVVEGSWGARTSGGQRLSPRPPGSDQDRQAAAAGTDGPRADLGLGVGLWRSKVLWRFFRGLPSLALLRG